MTQLTLWFARNDGVPELQATSFVQGLFERPLRTVRGKGSASLDGSLSFQWTPAVQALAILLLKTVAAQKTSSMHAGELSTLPHLAGESATPAASLDYAISKQTQWLLDMFGVQSCGTPFAKRLFKRQNPERKRTGPVLVWINESIIKSSEIKVLLDEKPVTDLTLLNDLANKISHNWRTITSKVNSENAKSEFKLGQQEKIPQLRKLGLQETLKAVFKTETFNVLANTDIFSPLRYKRLLGAVANDPIFQKLAGGKTAWLNGLGGDLFGSNRLGVSEDEAFLKRSLDSSEPIICALAPTFAGSLAIFEYLRSVKGYNICVNYKFTHSIDILQRLINSEFPKMPDLCVFTVATANSILNGTSALPYVPLMALPKISHRVIQRKRTSHFTKYTQKHETYMFFSEQPGTAAFFFEDLIRNSLVDRNRVTVSHMESDEITAAFQDDNDEHKAIMCFPHYDLNQIYNNCSCVNTPIDELGFKQTFLFVHESFSRERKRALEIAIRDAWLSLRQNHLFLCNVSDAVVENGEYVEFLSRVAGLHNLTAPSENLVLA